MSGRRAGIIGALLLAAVIAGTGRSLIGAEKKDGVVLARVGDRVITRDDFEEQFARQIFPDSISPDSARISFLESMIQKELLVLGARERGLFAPDTVLERRMRDYEDDQLRKRVKQDETKIDTTVTDKEIEKLFGLSTEELQLRHFQHWSRASVDSARKRIDQGEGFAQVAVDRSQDRFAAEGGLLPWVTQLRLIPEFRTAIASAVDSQAVGPFSSMYGWHLISVVGRRPREGADLELERPSLILEGKNERMRERQGSRLEEYKKRYRFKMDEPAIAALVDEASRILTAAWADSTRQGLSLAENWTPADTARVLATYEGDEFTAGDYHAFLVKEGPLFLRQRLIPAGAIATVRDIFYNEARRKEARRQGYDRDPEFKRQLELKREELVVERFYGQEIMAGIQVSDADARAYFKEHPDQFPKLERFRYSYIQVNDAGVAEALFAEMAGFDGAEFDSTADLLRESGHLISAERDSGFRDFRSTGAVGPVARTLSTGEAGLAHEADGTTHTVFVLILHEEGGLETFENARDTVARTLTNLRSEEKLVTLLRDLERKFPVERHPERLSPAG
jgi:parvulin-like peptidyl-prolyl isomerase